MKSFMQEYGIVAVVAITIIAFIAVGFFFRDKGTNSITEMLNVFYSESGNSLNQ